MKTANKKRVGFMITGAPARHGAKLFSNGEQVGEITSGTLSPTLKKPVVDKTKISERNVKNL